MQNHTRLQPDAWHMYSKTPFMKELKCPTINDCYVRQAVICFNCLEDKCLSHAIGMSTALTQLLIVRFSYLVYKG